MLNNHNAYATSSHKTLISCVPLVLSTQIVLNKIPHPFNFSIMKHSSCRMTLVKASMCLLSFLFDQFCSQITIQLATIMTDLKKGSFCCKLAPGCVGNSPSIICSWKCLKISHLLLGLVFNHIVTFFVIQHMLNYRTIIKFMEMAS